MGLTLLSRTSYPAATLASIEDMLYSNSWMAPAQISRN
jgi:hypothetical protein